MVKGGYDEKKELPEMGLGKTRGKCCAKKVSESKGVLKGVARYNKRMVATSLRTKSWNDTSSRLRDQTAGIHLDAINKFMRNMQKYIEVLEEKNLWTQQAYHWIHAHLRPSL